MENYFSKAHFQKYLQVKHAWPGIIYGIMTDWEVVLRFILSRTKFARKTNVGMWGQSRDPRANGNMFSPGVVRVLNLISEPGLCDTLADGLI
jgi:hypothetical protein